MFKTKIHSLSKSVVHLLFSVHLAFLGHKQSIEAHRSLTAAHQCPLKVPGEVWYLEDDTGATQE